MRNMLRLIAGLSGVALLLAAVVASLVDPSAPFAPAAAQEQQGQDDAEATATMTAVLEELAALQTQVAALQTQVAGQARETPSPTATPQESSPASTEPAEPTEPAAAMAEPVDCGEPVTGWGSAAIGDLRLNLLSVDREPTVDAPPPADATWIAFEVVLENLGSDQVTVAPRHYTLLACDGSILQPAEFSDIGGIGFQAGELAPMAEVTGSVGFAVPADVEPALLFYRIQDEDGCRGEFRFPLATGEPGESELMTQVLAGAGLEGCNPNVEGGTSTGGRDGGDGGDAIGGSATGGDGGDGGDAIGGSAAGGSGGSGGSGGDGGDAVGGDGTDGCDGADGGDATGGDSGAASAGDCPPG